MRINGSFVFGMDSDDSTVFDATVEWAIKQGITTATFHILTPYPGTALYNRMESQGRILHHHWDRYDTRHVVFQPKRMSPETLEEGYRSAYKEFYRWDSILRAAVVKGNLPEFARHVAYAGGWKKLEPFWKWIIKARQVSKALPLFERVLTGSGKEFSDRAVNDETVAEVAGNVCSIENLRLREGR